MKCKEVITEEKLLSMKDGINFLMEMEKKEL